jgi:hypothetical protein
MKCRPVLWICAASAVLLTHCAAFKSAKAAEPKAKPTTEGPQLVGRIASIPADKRFVLIQSYGKWNIAAGALLTTRGPEERTANLLATGESLGEFAAADLQSGFLEVGDAVYSRHVPRPADSASPVESPVEPAANQPQPQSEKIQKIINF